MAAEFQSVPLFYTTKKIYCQNSLKNEEIVVNWGYVGANSISMSSEASILFL